MSENRIGRQGPQVVTPSHEVTSSAFPSPAELAKRAKRKALPPSQRRAEELQETLQQMQAEYNKQVIDLGISQVQKEYRDGTDLHRLSPVGRVAGLFIPGKTHISDVVIVNNEDGSQDRYVDRQQRLFELHLAPGVYKEHYERDSKGRLYPTGERELVGDYIQAYRAESEDPQKGYERSFEVRTKRADELARQGQPLEYELEEIQQGVWKTPEQRAAERKQQEIEEQKLEQQIADQAARDRDRSLAARTLLSDKNVAVERRVRMQEYIEPGAPQEKTKLSAAERREVIGEWGKRVFLPFGPKQWVADRLMQFGLSGFGAFIGTSVLHQPITDVETGFLLVPPVLGIAMSTTTMKNRAEQLDDRLWSEYQEFRRTNLEVSSESALRREYANKLYLERNWVRAEKLKKKQPKITDDELVGNLKRKDYIANGAKRIAKVVPAAAIFLSTLATLHSGAGLAAAPVYMAYKTLESTFVAHGLDSFVALWASFATIPAALGAYGGLFNLRSKRLEARKVIELKKEQRKQNQLQ